MSKLSNKSHSSVTRQSLDEWLCYLEQLHSQEIDLGLARISQVAEHLGIDLGFAKVITVAGTNGKGTTCAFIENALLSEGHGVAVYSSPHIERFNERLRINKQDISDQPLIAAFEQIEQQRGEISLSYYEYTTLACFLVLMAQQPEYIILEVGLGGRLDATNIIDADIAVITTIDLDHQAFLGNDRETIGFEKAGIMRAGRLAVIGDTQVPKSVIDYGERIGAKMLIRNHDFYLQQIAVQLECEARGQQSQRWHWHCQDMQLTDLSAPFIPRDNVATALTVLAKLSLELTSDKVNQWLAQTKVPGRTEVFQQGLGHHSFDVMLDVGHNPQATRYLSSYLANCDYQRILAVVAMLADKDIEQTLLPLTGQIEQWFVGQLTGSRAAESGQLLNLLSQHDCSAISFDNVEQAYTMALAQAKPGDLVLVFGSFFTVAAIRPLLIESFTH